LEAESILHNIEILYSTEGKICEIHNVSQTGVCVWIYSEFALVFCGLLNSELRTEYLSQLNSTSVEKMNKLELEYISL
jgi:hypothetical protein